MGVCMMKIRLTNNLRNVQRNCIVGRQHDYLMNSAKISRSDILTENINACIAGVVSAGKTNMMFHLAPEQQAIPNLEDVFYRKMDEFFETAGTDDFDAVITGGWKYSSRDADTASKSIVLYNKVAELIEDLKGRLSIFCGKEQNDIDNLQFNNIGCTKLVSDNWAKYGINCDALKSKSPEEVARILENKYETVEIHPAHEFIV